jgi:hypothetical protein
MDDGYLGSGTWIRRISSKDDLQKQVLEHCVSFEELLVKEKEYIEKHIDDPLNMNFNNSSVGASVGKWNVAHRPDVKDKHRKDWIENNPMKNGGHTEETKEKIRKSMMGEKNHFYGRKHSDETKEKLRRIQLDRK